MDTIIHKAAQELEFAILSFMDVTIRKATIEDLKRVQELSQELFFSDYSNDPLLNVDWTYSPEGEKSFTTRIMDEDKFCFVAEIDGEIIGYASGSTLPVHAWRPVKRLEMENLIVTQKYRGQRIGEKLAQAVFDLGKSLGMERVMIAAYATNDGAIKFYQRIGCIPDTLHLEKVLDK
ncbi:MAG TPA: GNAT family N-acetyltransferase [Candidatus Eisenbacteria bacterium]|nr:GNAT family N-acetyltransferase [Candidatus Eisenbacteria bacterium]